MRIIVVDNNMDALKQASACIANVQPEAELLCFDSSPNALAEARKRELDIAFLKTELDEIDGFDLGQYLRELHPLINLIYMSNGQECAYQAMKIHASGYLLQPISEEAVRQELSDLRHPASQKAQKRVFAQTFGNFEFFVDGKPVAFKYTRTKEIVALLINNRGAQTTNGEIIGTLWEDDGDPDKKASYLSNLRQDLQNTLARLKVADIIIKQRGSLGIDVNKIECDLYDWLEKKKDSRYRYMGDYMNQYSWAEYVHAELDEISYALDNETYE